MYSNDFGLKIIRGQYYYSAQVWLAYTIANTPGIYLIQHVMPVYNIVHRCARIEYKIRMWTFRKSWWTPTLDIAFGRGPRSFFGWTKYYYNVYTYDNNVYTRIIPVVLWITLAYRNIIALIILYYTYIYLHYCRLNHNYSSKYVYRYHPWYSTII